MILHGSIPDVPSMVFYVVHRQTFSGDMRTGRSVRGPVQPMLVGRCGEAYLEIVLHSERDAVAALEYAEQRLAAIWRRELGRESQRNDGA